MLRAFHAEGLAGSKLHYAVQLTIQPVLGFENGNHHFPAAKSALPAVDEPPTNVPSSPRYHYFCVAVRVASLITATSVATGDSTIVHALLSLAPLHVHTMPCPQEMCYNNCTHYLHSYIHRVSMQQYIASSSATVIVIGVLL